jgi:hypothetical protein
MNEELYYFLLPGTAVVSNQNTYWHLSLLEDRLVYTFFALFCLIGIFIRFISPFLCQLPMISPQFS